MKRSKQAHYSSNAAILAEARISDDPEILRIDQLAPEIQAHIASARLKGFHPVSVRWPGGQFALMFCEPGTCWPSVKNVITAYKHCLKTTQVFPQGTQHE
jgi:hypothetical protein